jgi:hypothetical protein
MQIQEYDYSSLKEKLNTLKGIDKNKTEYIEYAIEILTEEYLQIAGHLGDMDAIKAICKTVTGTKSLNLTNEQVILASRERQIAESALYTIDEVIRLTKKKLEFLVE